MMILTCGCCGMDFSTDEEFPDHDVGFGDCPRCAEDMQIANEAEWALLEKKVRSALSPAHQAAWDQMSMTLRRGFIVDQVEKGHVRWVIGRKEMKC